MNDFYLVMIGLMGAATLVLTLLSSPFMALTALLFVILVFNHDKEDAK